MPKRPHEPDDPRHPRNNNVGWSIGSNRLTAAGQSELLKSLGRQLQDNYQNVLREPAPDRLRRLVERLEDPRGSDEDES
jgi:Anti-sigma factor NepR